MDGGDVQFTTEKWTAERAITEDKRFTTEDAREVGAADGGGVDFPPKVGAAVADGQEVGGEKGKKNGEIEREEVDEATAGVLAAMFRRHADAVSC